MFETVRMSRVLLLGAYGLLGTSLFRCLVESGHVVLRQGRSNAAEIYIDPTCGDAIKSLLAVEPIDIIVNLVAATNVDQCEVNPQSAYQANAEVVEALVEALGNTSKNRRPHLVHISTDQVYDGPGPHGEGAVAPCNVYALSKLAGEFAAARIGATVLRVNFIGHSRCVGRNSLTDWIVNSLRAGQKITVFEDVFFSPLHINILCQAIELAIRKHYPGTFNVASRDGRSKAHLAFGLAERLGLDLDLMTIGRAQDIKLRACRPLDMRMDSSRFERGFGFAAPTFESQIDITAQEYRNEQAPT